MANGANGVTSVDLQEIMQKATELKPEDMFDVLERAKKTIDNTEQNFNSGEGEEMRQQFDAYSTKFQNFRDDVTKFSEHMDSFAQTFGDTQSKLKNILSQLPKAR